MCLCVCQLPKWPCGILFTFFARQGCAEKAAKGYGQAGRKSRVESWRLARATQLKDELVERGVCEGVK